MRLPYFADPSANQPHRSPVQAPEIDTRYCPSQPKGWIADCDGNAVILESKFKDWTNSIDSPISNVLLP